jgi:hypothetical protein
MNHALWEVSCAFAEVLPPEPIEKGLEVLQAQIDEAREHLENGNDEKALAEVADCISIAFQVLWRHGKDPEKFTETRIRERILPRIPEMVQKYHRQPVYVFAEPERPYSYVVRVGSKRSDYGYCDTRKRTITVTLAPHVAAARDYVGGDVPEYVLQREVIATIAHEDLHAAIVLPGKKGGHNTRKEHRMIARALDWTGYGYRG